MIPIIETIPAMMDKVSSTICLTVGKELRKTHGRNLVITSKRPTSVIIVPIGKIRLDNRTNSNGDDENNKT
jgi:hypothetical protein